MKWDEFLDAVEHRLGMFTGRPTYERAVSLVTGFDLGAGTDICQRMQQRARQQRGAGPISWTTALLWQVTQEPRPDARLLTPEQNEMAIKLLVTELRSVVSAASAADASGAAEPQSAAPSLIKRVVYDFGSLVTVSNGSAEALDAANPARFEQYEFGFERGRLSVRAVADDDTVELSEQRIDSPHMSLLTGMRPWSAAVGSGVVRVWLLVNHDGYRDALQIEFGRSSGYLSVQLECEASDLKASVVGETRA